MPTHFRAYTAAGDVVHEAATAADGSASFDAGDEVIASVVFYSGGQGDSESVAGVVAVDASGLISVALPE